MAVVVTDLRSIVSEADTTTGWTGSNSVSLFTAEPTAVEATGCLGMVVSNATQNAYYTQTSADFSDVLIYAWIFHRAELDTLANGGVMIQLGDGTNRIGFHVAGNDSDGFRHQTGPVGWQCVVLDTSQIGTLFTAVSRTTAFAGSLASLNLAAITQVGVGFKTLVKAVGGVSNCFWDIVRSGNGGLRVTGGTSGTPGTFEDISSADRLTGNQQAHGVVRKLGTGVYGVQGSLFFGEATGSSSSWFEDKSSTVVFESRDLTAGKYKITVNDNGTGTSTFRLGTKVGSGSTAVGTEGVSIIAAPGVGLQFDSVTDTDVTDVFIYGSSFVGFEQGIQLNSGQEFIGGSISASGTVEPNGAVLVNSSITSSTSTVALLWNQNLDTLGYLDGISFQQGTAGHAIELGSSTPSEITLSKVSFTGYGADSTTDAAVYNNSGKSIIVNISGGGGTPTVRNGTSASTTVINAVTLTLTGIVSGSDIVILDAGTSTVRVSVDQNVPTTYNHTYGYVNNDFVDIGVFKVGYIPFYVRSYQLGPTDGTLPISQVSDRNYFNPA